MSFQRVRRTTPVVRAASSIRRFPSSSEEAQSIVIK
jgi:hypothetical protein